MEQKLLSIVIATKDRGKYCIEAIKSILSIVNEQSELIVHDNSTHEDLKMLASEINDPRLIYRYDNSPLSVVGNYNKALQLSTGEYICLLGDDDTVMPAITDIVLWMRAENIESVSGKQNLNYTWPNNDIPKFRTGELIIPSFTNTIQKVDPHKQLLKLLDKGIINYQAYGLPRLYHGIVKRSCLEKIREVTGHYVGGLSTDIYTSFALSTFVTEHYVIDHPFTIAGACPASTTVAGMEGKHSGILRDAIHFKNRGKYEWEKTIPAYYSIETIWAESALKALKEMKRNDLYERFNLHLFLTTAIIANRKHILNLALKETYKIVDSLWFRIRLLLQVSVMTAQKIFRIVTKKQTAQHVSQEIYSLNDAVTVSVARLKPMLP